MSTYNPTDIENNWKEKWYEDNIYEAVDFSKKPKKYILAEWPYPSGKSLHIGHAMRYTVPEVYSRYLRMKGYNVLFPMGWDAFGLPTEGYALKTGKTPQEVTRELETAYKKSMQDIGYAMDWYRELNSTNPKYYKWTQWLFLKFYEHGLAKLEEMPVWWCKELGNLADEEIVLDEKGNKVSERGGHPVERKLFKQWVLKIPEYADKLLEGLDQVDFPDHIKIAQRNWIGKSEGTLVEFEVGKDIIEVFTTRADTLYGVTFLALAPEHPLVETLTTQSTNSEAVKTYVKRAKNMSDLERQTTKEKTGIKLEGIVARHPMKEVETPLSIFITNYVLKDYGTGVVMGVPAHDERDHEFAKNYGVEIKKVIKPTEGDFEESAFTDYGILLNSEEFSGLASDKAIEKITKKLEKLGKGKKETTYKIRDWVFSRQHYWGEPIPLVYKEDGTTEALVNTEDMEEVHEKLPLKLPDSVNYRPLSDGSAPLAREEAWVNTTDSENNPAKRETQTMPTWAGSSWYYLRFADPHNEKEFANKKNLEYWLPVDRYFGGAEHTTVHLLYSRFWHKFFYDIGLVNTPEPYQWRMNGGLLLAEDGRKMSKRYGNLIEPKELIDNYGADATRLAICFLGPYTDTYPWNPGSIKATWRLLKTIWELKDKVAKEKTPNLLKPYHKMVKKITHMIENLKMNTAVSEIMIFINEAKGEKTIDENLWKGFIKVLAPLAPFLAEELWQEINGFTKWDKKNSIHVQNWPEYDEKLAKEDTLTIPVQINGKVRGEIKIEENESEKSIRKKALPFAKDNEVKKVVYVPGKIVNLVV